MFIFSQNILSKIYSRIIIIVIMLTTLSYSIFLLAEIYETNNRINKHIQMSSFKNNLTYDDLADHYKAYAIGDGDTIYYFDDGRMVFKKDMIKEYTHIHSAYFYEESTFKPVIIYNGKVIYLDLFNNIDKFWFVMKFGGPFVILIIAFVFYTIIKDESKLRHKQLMSVEADMTNRSMIMITENIHHELNTPLEIIDNKIEKIYNIFKLYMTEHHAENTDEERRGFNKALQKLDEDFGFIRTSSEQIYAVLEKMKGFKHLRYSNGNKSIYDIIDGAFKIIEISTFNYDYDVSENLKKYSIINLKNAELLSIFLNHIKNSIEAHASKIIVTDEGIRNDCLLIRIIDNGNGIPDEFQKKLFKPNSSTKGDENGIRGNGMSINKEILEDNGGTVRLVRSSSSGTTIELRLRFKKREVPAV